MILSLRSSSASERRAHVATHSAARARISHSEAQLAHREAELEVCMMHAGQPIPRASTSSGNTAVLPPFPPPMPTSDMKVFLERTCTDNVVLEEEFNRLNSLVRLHGVRGRTNCPEHLDVTVRGLSCVQRRCPPIRYSSSSIGICRRFQFFGVFFTVRSLSLIQG